MNAILVALVLGGTIHNGDSHEYRLRVKAGDAEVSVPINANTTLEKVCPSFPCTLRNEDTEHTVKLTASDQHVSIKDGSFAVSGEESGGGGGGSDAPAAPEPKPGKKPGKKKGK
jgi:hypothetical protein